MTATAIFLLGLFVTAITGAGALLIGLDEASDLSQNLEDLTSLEKKVVGREEEE